MLCGKCGKEIANNSEFCQFCGEKVKKEEPIAENNSNEQPQYRICPKCKKKVLKTTPKCKYCGYNINTPILDKDTGDFIEGLFGLIIIIGAVIFLFVGCCKAVFTDESQNTPKQTPQQKIEQEKKEQEQRQTRLNEINKILKNAEKAGLIKNYRKDDEGKNLHILVDENIWNQLPYDTKQQMWQMCFEYHKLTGYLTGIVGYYSGKSLK